MGTRYTTTPAVSFNSAPPPDDGTQVAGNLVQWSMVKTKLADPVHVQADAIDSKLVSALDLSARAISTPDTAVASDHWKTLQVTGTTTITLSSAASMGAGYEVGVFNAGVGVVTVTPGAAADTINGLSASVTVSIKGTKIFRTNQALTGYNVVGGYDPQTVTATTSVVTPLVGTASAASLSLQANSTAFWELATDGSFRPGSGQDNAIDAGQPTRRIAHVFTPIIDTGTTGGGSLRTNNGGATALSWDNNKNVSIGAALDLTAASAGQIQFPAAQNASAGANVLDDYEEGTWTPSIGGSATYTTQTGTYTKIGRLVYVNMVFTINVIGTGSTTVISGLPFTAANDTTFVVRETGSATSTVFVVGSLSASGTTITLLSKTAAATAASANAIFANGATVRLSGSYEV